MRFPTWHQAGNRTGHCSACHRTFSGITTFDAHQRMVDERSVCLDPGSLVDKAGALRFRAFTDRYGATVWRSATSLPEGVFDRDAGDDGGAA